MTQQLRWEETKNWSKDEWNKYFDIIAKTCNTRELRHYYKEMDFKHTFQPSSRIFLNCSKENAPEIIKVIRYSRFTYSVIHDSWFNYSIVYGLLKYQRLDIISSLLNDINGNYSSIDFNEIFDN